MSVLRMRSRTLWKHWQRNQLTLHVCVKRNYPCKHICVNSKPKTRYPCNDLCWHFNDSRIMHECLLLKRAAHTRDCMPFKVDGGWNSEKTEQNLCVCKFCLFILSTFNWSAYASSGKVTIILYPCKGGINIFMCTSFTSPQKDDGELVIFVSEDVGHININGHIRK